MANIAFGRSPGLRGHLLQFRRTFDLRSSWISFFRRARICEGELLARGVTHGIIHAPCTESPPFHSVRHTPVVCSQHPVALHAKHAPYRAQVTPCRGLLLTGGFSHVRAPAPKRPPSTNVASVTITEAGWLGRTNVRRVRSGGGGQGGGGAVQYLRQEEDTSTLHRQRHIAGVFYVNGTFRGNQRSPYQAFEVRFFLPLQLHPRSTA